MDSSALAYTALPTATSIRVLKIHPSRSDDDAILQCTLHLFDLEDPGLQFSALSYTWGDPHFRYWYEKKSATFSQDVPIICDGVQVRLTANLEAALRAISRRREEEELFRGQTAHIWVDSLCINQSNVQERNAQVSLMARIYSSAAVVVSWLGPADADSEVAIPLIQRLLKMIRSVEVDESSSDDRTTIFAKTVTKEGLGIPDAHYTNLARFYARNYFFRCWILQEMVLARHIRIFCGVDEIRFRDLHTVADVITYIKIHRLAEPIGQEISLPMKLNWGTMHEAVIADLHNYHNDMAASRLESRSSPFEFHRLITLTQTLGCTDPKDKIYSTLGLVSQGSVSIEPDYNKSVEEVYGEATRHWINETRCLNCLSWVTNKPQRSYPLAPSWVGEFELFTNASAQSLAFSSVTHSATGNSAALAVDLKPQDPLILSVRGKEIDRIVELAEPWAWHGLGVGYDPLWTSMTLKLPEIYPTGQPRGEALIYTFVANEVDGAYLSSLSDMDNFKSTVRRDTSFALIRELHRLCWLSDPATPTLLETSALHILTEIETLAHSDPSNFIPSLLEIRGMQSVTCSCPLDLTSLPSSTPVADTEPNPACLYMTELQRNRSFKLDSPSAIPNAPSVPDAQNWDSRFSGAMNHVMRSRRVARTEKGFLGLVPDSAAVGDRVWLLKGGSVAFVLRKVDREGKGRWEVVGDAYVHGVMRGEVWDKIKEAELVDLELV